MKKKINMNGAFLTILASKVEDIKIQIWRVGGDCKALFTEFRNPQIPSDPLYQTLNDFSLTLSRWRSRIEKLHIVTDIKAIFDFMLYSNTTPSLMRVDARGCT